MKIPDGVPKPKRLKKIPKMYQWLKFRKGWLKGKADHTGRYECNDCGIWTLEPEVDHIIKRSVRPDLIFEPSNLQILCHNCHLRKDFGMKFDQPQAQ